MNQNWVKVFLATFFEVFWVIGFKYASTSWTWIGTIISLLFSFYLMIDASRTLPVGTVYAIFVGMGTAGTFIAEVLFFHEPFQLEKMLLIITLLIGVIGLKLVTQEDGEGDRS